MQPREIPEWCAIMDFVSDETRARMQQADRTFTRIEAQLKAARAELRDAIIAERKEGTLIEDITAMVHYRQTQVNRILETAGLTEKRGPRAGH